MLGWGRLFVRLDVKMYRICETKGRQVTADEQLKKYRVNWLTKMRFRALKNI